MPIERVDFNVPGVLNPEVAAQVSQNRMSSDEKIAEGDTEAAARKAAEKKIAEKQAQQKQGVVQRETFQRSEQLSARMQQILGGAAGPEPQQALAAWGNNASLQQKLTEAQKNHFRESMAQSPQRGAEAANALNRLTQLPGFQKAVTSAQQMGTLQAGVLEQPKRAEKTASDLLQSRFMQSPKADAQVKNQFMRFGLQQAQGAELASIKRAGDMLGALAGNDVPRVAQRAAMAMVQRQPADTKAMGNVDAFVQHAAVQAMPSFARGKATELLAKSGGKAEVKEGFEQLASDGKFKTQNAQAKGRFFATIGTGRPSEYRSLTDKALVALQSQEFPSRSAQVQRFLGKMATQIHKGGADSVNPKELLREAKKSAAPPPPVFQSTAGLSDEEATAVRAQNRGKMLHFFNQLTRSYEQAEKKLGQAKYLEDVNALQNLREPPAVDASALSPEERALYEDRSQSVKQKRAQVLKLQQQRARELRGKRMPPAKRRAMQAERRAVGRQPRYFSPNATRQSGSQAFVQAAVAGAPQRQPGLAETPVRAQLAAQQAAPGGGMARPQGGAARGAAQRSSTPLGGAVADIHDQVKSAVANLGHGPMTPDKAGQVAQVIARQVAAQVAQQITQQVTEQLLGVQVAVETAAEPMSDTPSQASQPKKTSGRTDGWGIQRTFDRDLGAAQRAPVKPPPEPEASPAPTYEQVAAEKYTGKMLVKDPSALRSMDELLATRWKELSKPEAALLKNLGWSQQMWDTKDTPAGKWPMAMATPFVSLSPTQREAVRKLGFSPQDWDKRVQAMSMGKNA